MQAKGNLDLIPGCPPSYTLSVRLVQNIGQAIWLRRKVHSSPESNLMRS
jgi:hypothetical protein